MKYFKLLLLISSMILFTACGGGGGSSSSENTIQSIPPSTQEIAINKIKAYADNQTNPVPSIEDYENAGVNGVTSNNINTINNIISSLTPNDVDSPEKIQEIVNSLGINIIPTVNAGVDKTVTINNSVTIAGTATDIDGLIVSYEWKNATTTLSTNPTFTYTPAAAGTDILTLSVMDDDGATASDSMSVVVTETPMTVAEPVSLTLVSILDNDVRETSGLENVNGKMYTHNDSGGSNLLYEINAITGDVIRSITVNGASNVDWEDLASDNTYLYIGDIGNNLGSRNDLKIYKILKSDLDVNNMVNAETIAFSYADQKKFNYDPFTTPYDAEALVAYNGQLYVFTKNWADHTSRIYNVPTVPGSYEVVSVGDKTLDVMVTGADINEAGSSVALVGYTNPYDKDTQFKSMIVKLSGFSGNNFFSGSITEHEIENSQVVGQVEAILFNTSSEFYLSAEELTWQSIYSPAKLYETEIIE